MLNEISVTEHYDNLVEENNDPVFDTESLKEYMDKWDGNEFLRQLRINPEIYVLEIGVGTGRLALRVLQQGCKYFEGIDISHKTIKKAGQNLRMYSNCSLIEGDFLTTEFDKSFDVIYSSLTFFHIANKEAAIKKVEALLNSNGRFVLSIDKNCLNYLEYQQYKVQLYPDDLEQTIELLEICGLNSINVFEAEFAYIITANKSL